MRKFEYIGIVNVDEDGNELPVNSYMGQKVKNGDVVELNDFFAKKAERNPDYREFVERKKPGPKPKKEEQSDIID